MGFLDELETMELSDEVKEQLRREHISEIEEKDTLLSDATFESRKAKVEAEIQGLKEIDLSEPGLLKYVRRVYLSDDGDVATVLLSDADLQLSGDEAVGARSKEEKSSADILRGFIELLPRNQEGKLDLGGMALSDDAGDPPKENDDPEEEHKERHQHAEKWLGRSIKRTRTRYDRSGATGGGEN